MNVLVAEDKPAMADLLTRALRREGHSVLLAHDGQEALDLGRSGDSDVILLDVMLPRVDGFTVIRTLRAERMSTPTLILSARDAMSDIVMGLDSGADDYLTKPFSLDVLHARIRALGRRLQVSAQAEVAFRDMVLNSSTHELNRAGRASALTRAEFALMAMLMRGARSIVSHSVLIEAGWGLGAEVNEGTLYVFIKILWEKIGEPQLLRTVRGVGYALRV